MAIEIKEGDYLLGMWVLSGPTANWMCVVSKRDDQWKIQYRFRYFVDTKVWGSNDKRSFYSAVCEGSQPEEKLIQQVDMIVAGLKEAGFGQELERTMIRSYDMEDFQLATSGMKSISSRSESDAGGACEK